MRQNEPTTRSSRNRGSFGAVLGPGAVATVALLALLVPVAAAGADRGLCPSGEEPETDLGVSALRCRDCTLSRNERDGSRLWRFRTEPEILGVRSGGPAEGVLREGDRVVAVDGFLITTVEGGRRWSSVQPGQRVELRVRRRGRVETVEVVARTRCPEDPEAWLGKWGSVTVPGSPAGLPDPPEPPETILPRGWLGFGLSCRCRVQSGEDAPRWTFDEPPAVGKVAESSPAERAGFREGDLLEAIDGEELTGEAGAERFSKLRPGDRVRFTVRRDGAREVLEVVAGERPQR